MWPRQSTIIALAAAAALACTAHTAVARVDVTVEFDKSFDFKSVRTWGWDATGPGDVKMARTKYDNPESMKARAEPPILEEVATVMPKSGLQRSDTAPDLTLKYYLLLTTNMTAQTVGQFLPATTGWGLPPFAQATQSLKVMNQGSLVLDLSAKDTVVWRGLAQAKLQVDAEDKKREAVLREAVRDLLRRYPPKP